MPTKKLIPLQDEKLVEFLTEDFRDTAMHLRDTDRKIEFTFQLYAGALSLLSSIVITFLAFGFGSQNWKVEYNFYVMQAILFLLTFIWLFTFWAFSYSIKGTRMKALYLNRMNFLRNEIYKCLGKEMEKNPAFFYVKEYLPSGSLQKVGMVDMFPLAYRFALILLPVPIFIILYYILKASGVHIHWATMFIPMVLIIVVVSYTKNTWVKIVQETSATIKSSWNIQ
jgi:hypothetical protein